MISKMFLVSTLVVSSAINLSSVVESDLDNVVTEVLSKQALDISQAEKSMKRIVSVANKVLETRNQVEMATREVAAKLADATLIEVYVKCNLGTYEPVFEEAAALKRAKVEYGRAVSDFKEEYSNIVSKSCYKNLPPKIQEEFVVFCDSITNVSGWKKTSKAAMLLAKYVLPQTIVAAGGLYVAHYFGKIMFKTNTTPSSAPISHN